MADKLMRAQVTIPIDSNLPEDSIVNTWYFDGDDDAEMVDEDYGDQVMTMLTTFYQAIDGVVLASNIGANASVKIYDMRDAEPRVPERTDTIALAPAASEPYPNEVAICLSFAAEFASGVNPARRRGRIFLGPIASEVGNLSAGQVRVGSAAQTAIADAAATMQDGLVHEVGSVLRTRWAVYSPKTHQVTGDIGAAFNDVLTGWVDDSFDTQRRRGYRTTSRTVWP